MASGPDGAFRERGAIEDDVAASSIEEGWIVGCRVRGRSRVAQIWAGGDDPAACHAGAFERFVCLDPRGGSEPVVNEHDCEAVALHAGDQGGDGEIADAHLGFNGGARMDGLDPADEQFGRDTTDISAMVIGVAGRLTMDEVVAAGSRAARGELRRWTPRHRADQLAGARCGAERGGLPFREEDEFVDCRDR